MARCLELASLAEGRTSPNPMVGSVILSPQGSLIAEGYHQAAGQPHAEAQALQIAGGRARGATLFVNLEPCCHHGRTPPCAEAIVKAGVKKVVVAMEDPNPVVRGQGFQILRDAGIEIVTGIREDEARWLNRGFIKTVQENSPWLALKLATTLDGRIADRYGKSQWITGSDARLEVHRLRNKFDAVMVGAGTVRFDNPRLNVREIEDSRDPYKVVVDPSLSLENDCNLLKNCAPGTYIFHKSSTTKEANYGEAKLVGLAPDDKGLINLAEVLSHISSVGINTVLCEGGGRLAGELLANNLVDEIYWYIAPRLLPDSKAVAATSTEAVISMDDAIDFDVIESKTVGRDTLIHLRRIRKSNIEKPGSG